MGGRNSEEKFQSQPSYSDYNIIMKTICQRHGRCCPVLVLAILALWPADLARAQGRGAFQVGGLTKVGSRSNFGNAIFNHYSTGSGGASAGSPTGVLASSLRSTGIRSRSGATPRMPSSFSGAAARNHGTNTTRMLYRPGVSNRFGMNFGRGSGLVRTLRSNPGASMVINDPIVGIESGLVIDPAPIRTFVPAGTGKYAELMRLGEKSFRAGDFRSAAEWFSVACQFVRGVPETHLSLVHANVSLGNYALTALDLRLAIRYFPELPLANIDLASFYRSEDRLKQLRNRSATDAKAPKDLRPMALDRLRRRLDAHAKRPHGDANMWFSLAYVMWFDGEPAKAAEALRKAVKISGDPLLTEAIEVFWAGCVATGKISGDLTPSVDSAKATTRPVKEAAGASEPVKKVRLSPDRDAKE